MCYAIVEVKYKAQAQPAITVKCADEEGLRERVDYFQSLDAVERVTVYCKSLVMTREIGWATSAGAP